MMPKRLSESPPGLALLATRFVGAPATEQESENIAERAQHTVTTDEPLSVQTARISDEADKRQDAKRQKFKRR